MRIFDLTEAKEATGGAAKALAKWEAGAATEVTTGATAAMDVVVAADIDAEAMPGTRYDSSPL